MGDHNERSGTSRRRFLKTLGAAGAAAVAGSGAAQSRRATDAQGTDEVIALTNGRIHTIDGRNSVVSSVVIRDGRIAAAGGGRPPAGARVIDLKGRTVVPGLIEPHVHIVSLANRPGYHTILENTTSIREVQEALAERRKSVPEGQWITSMGGWHPNQWAEHRHPTLEELDEAVPDRPVFLYERFTGPAAVNSLAKKFFDAADAGAPVHPDIRKIGVSATGAIGAAGFGGGGPCASALFLLRRMQTFADKRRSTVDAMNYSTSLGLTTHLDQVLFPTPGPLHPNQILSNLDPYTMYDPWLSIYHEGKATVRLQINFLSNQADPALPELHERLRNQFQFVGDDMVRTGAIGEWAAPISAGNDLTFVVRRASTADLASVWVRASAERGQLLHRQQIEFPAGATEASLTLDLPSELRNRIVRVELEQQRSAASIALLDERWRRRPVGLVSGESLEADQPLLSGLYYVERALQPYADLRHGTVSALLERELSVMVLADVGRLVGADRTALTTWVQEGGILVRFAGPHLAAESDDLLPVALRQIGRAHV